MAESKLVVMLKLDGTELGKGITKAQADIAKIGAAFTGVGVAVGAAVKFAADFQDSTIKAARAAGVASQSFSALAYSAGLSGLSTQELGKNLVKLQNPTELAERTFKDLGLTARDASGHFKSQGVLLEELADKFATITDPATKSQAALRIFGEEGVKMVSMLEGGAKGLAEARAEAFAFGQTVSEQAGKNAEQFNDSIAKMNMGLSGLRNVVAESIIEFTNQSGVFESLQNVTKGLIADWRSLSDGTKNAIITVGALAVGFGALLLVLSGVAAALPALAAGFALLMGPVGAAIAVLAGLALAFKTLTDFRDREKIANKEQYDEAIKGVGAMQQQEAALIALSKKTKLSGDDQEQLAKIKAEVARRALAAGQSIDVQTMSLQQLINKTKEYRDLEKSKALGALNKELVEHNAKYIEHSKTLDTLIKQKEIYKGTAAADINADAIKRVTEAYNKEAAALAAIGAKMQALNEAEETAVATALRLSDTTKKQTTNWQAAEVSVDSFSAAWRDFNAAFIDDLDESEAAIEDFNQKYSESLEDMERSTKTAGFVKALADKAQEIIKPIGDLMAAISSGTSYAAEVAVRDIEVLEMRASEAYEKNRAALEESENAKIAALEKSFDDQINMIESQEAARNDIAARAAAERLLIADDEYQKQKELMQQAFEAEMEQDRINYEAKLAELEFRAIDKEQRQLTETVMEEDYRLYKENRERAHEQKLADFAKEYANKINGIDSGLKAEQKAREEASKLQIEALTNQKNEALTTAEAEKNAKLKDLETKRAAEEKAFEKQRLQTQYDAQVSEFEQMQAVKIAQTTAAGIAAAAQAFASMAALGPWGLPLGAALAATIAASTAVSVSNLTKQKPIKPAGLLEDGGFIGGNARHSTGGIPAEVESGEMFIDRNRTAKMLKAIDSNIIGGAGSGGVVIKFEAGAIQGDIRDERTMETLAVRLGQLIQRQMIYA